MTRLLPLTLSLWMLLSLDGCVSSPAERAALDEQVGKASTEGAQLVVEHGHAAVRGLSPGSMTLWSSCLLYTSPSPRDGLLSRMPSSA